MVEAVTQAGGAAAHTTTVYSYDALDRLTEEAVATDEQASQATRRITRSTWSAT